jgi:hypothetical protein
MRWGLGWAVVVGVDRRDVIGHDRFISEGFATPSDRQ